MTSRLWGITFDAADHIAQARWWAKTLGWHVVHESEREGVILSPTQTGNSIVFVPVPEPKTTKNRIHLDLASESLDEQMAIFWLRPAETVETSRGPDEHRNVDPFAAVEDVVDGPAGPDDKISQLVRGHARGGEERCGIRLVPNAASVLARESAVREVRSDDRARSFVIASREVAVCAEKPPTHRRHPSEPREVTSGTLCGAQEGHVAPEDQGGLELAKALP